MDVDADSPATQQVRSGWSWQDLLRWSAIATMLVTLVVVVIFGGFIPPLIVGFFLLGIGLWLSRRPGRAGVLTIGIVSLLLFLVNLPFAIPSFAHPDSAWDFVLIGLMMVSLLVSIIAAFAVLRSRTDGGAPRSVGLAAIALSLVIVVIAVVAGLSAKNDTSSPGDIALEAKNVKWTTETLTAKAGTIAIFVDNKDQTRHDFTIDKVVKKDLPAAKDRRVRFDVNAGTYKYYCSIHKDQMKGTLTVS
jgi:plastocyanin